MEGSVECESPLSPLEEVLRCIEDRGYSISDLDNEWLLSTRSPTSRLIVIRIKKDTDIRKALKDAADNCIDEDDGMRPKEVLKSARWMSQELRDLSNLANEVYDKRNTHEQG